VDEPGNMTNPPIVQVRLTHGPIEEPQSFPPFSVDPAGAVLLFRGIVRPFENDANEVERSITGLEYQIYEPMTSRELVRLAKSQQAKHGVVAIDVEHSHGLVSAGECSFVLQVASKHRGEAIRLMDEFIIEMKRHVPIWKVPAFDRR
jgi:molybdopterin synthase catalytic subunit